MWCRTSVCLELVVVVAAATLGAACLGASEPKTMSAVSSLAAPPVDMAKLCAVQGFMGSLQNGVVEYSIYGRPQDPEQTQWIEMTCSSAVNQCVCMVVTPAGVQDSYTVEMLLPSVLPSTSADAQALCVAQCL